MSGESEILQRAEDNERLRREAIAELESTRAELNTTIRELSAARADTLKLSKLLADRDQKLDRIMAERREKEATDAELIRSLSAQVERLKKQTARPVRLMAKRILRSKPHA